ncbi:enoyl-CoA hydratase-related protein [Hyphomonas sp.]|uniref:enoyl-CoA hydratase/isomerase family protein n=1 Tax=Hyphomonas sp. TaxID=87 RepID=UPI002638F13B|nr:enoyl-CoA hydratase-related protein [Hyphomonas sp.]
MPTRIGDIHIVRDDFVATVTIDRPPVNSMSVGLMRDLADALEALGKDGLTRAVVLAAGGNVFCAGADLTRRADEIGIAAQADAPGTNPLYEQAVRLFSTELPIVAAIQGAAVGAGLGLSMVADMRIAAPEARFAANFVKLGFHPGFGLTYTLPRLIGRNPAEVMLLTGARIDAAEAQRIGLVNEIVLRKDLLSAAQTHAASIAENAPLAVRSTRKTLRADLAEGVRAATDREFKEQQWLMKTDDFGEGVKAVNERRPGDFRGC